jgi:hypothetical protein
VSVVWEATYPLQHWKLDDVESASSQIAAVKQQQAESASISLPSHASIPREHPQESTRHRSVPNWEGNESPSAHAATDDFSQGDQVETDKMEVGKDESTTEGSNEAYLQSLHDSAERKFLRALVHMNEGIEISQEELSKMCLDADDGHPRVHETSDTCRSHNRRDSSSIIEAMASSVDDSNTDEEEEADDLEATQDGVGGLTDRGGEVQSTWDSKHAAGKRRKARRKGLLGESGKVLQAVVEALGEIKDVHTSDELMHFEFCGPFLELSEV